MTQNKRTKILHLCIYLASGIGIAAMLYCIPYFKDDWAWGSQIGLDRLHSWFDGYNGRYLGNLLVLVLTRSKILKTIIMTAGVFALPLLVGRITDKRIFLLFPLCLIFLFTMPSDLFRQTVEWASGFSNYMPPVLITLSYIFIVKNVFEEEAPSYKPITTPGVFLLGVCGALFMEHITLYNILLGIVVLSYAKIKFKQYFAPHVSFTAGAVVGAVIMFTNSSYGLISSGADEMSYRSVAVGGTITRYFETIGANIEIITNNLIECNAILNIFLAAMVCILTHRLYKTEKVNKTKKIWLNIAAGICVAYAIYCSVLILCIKIGRTAIVRNSIAYGWRFAFTLLFSAALLLSICLAVKNKTAKLKMLFSLVSVYVFAAPLFIVTPLTARCFLPCYAMLMLLACRMFQLVYSATENKKKAARNTGITFAVCLVLLGIFYTTVFTQIDSFTKEREAFVAQQIEEGRTKVFFPKYPSYPGDYIRGVTPMDGSIWEERLKTFYGIDEDIDLIILNNKFYNSIKDGKWREISE